MSTSIFSRITFFNKAIDIKVTFFCSHQQLKLLHKEMTSRYGKVDSFYQCSWRGRLVANKYFFGCNIEGLDIHKQVKINDKNEQRLGIVMTPLSISEWLKYRDIAYSDMMSILVNYFWHWLYVNHSELDYGVVTTPKHCLFLLFIFTCLNNIKSKKGNIYDFCLILCLNATAFLCASGLDLGKKNILMFCFSSFFLQN